MTGKGNKGKKKGGQPKGKKAHKKNAQKKSSGGSTHGGFDMLAHQACSVTNPFCPAALGSKWPDNSMVKSNTWSIDGQFVDLTSNASGDASALFIPAYNYQTVASATVIGDAVTYGATATTVTGPPAGVNRWRLTSWGLRLTVATPTMTTQGFVQIRGLSPIAYTALGSFSKGSRLTDFCEDIPLTRLLNNDYFVIPMPLGQDARTWRNATDYSLPSSWQTPINPGWQIINIGVSGGIASTTVLKIAMFYHFEFMMDDGNSISLYATPAPGNSPPVQAANASILQKVGNVIEGTAKKVDAVVKSKAFSYFKAFAASYLSKNPSVGMAMIADQPRYVD